MRRHTVTFERIEQEFDIGAIRSISVDHERRRIVIVSDSDDFQSSLTEGATISGGSNFTTLGSYS